MPSSFDAMLRRATLEALYDDGAHQVVDIRGLVGDRPRGVHRIQSFGLSAVPPAGAHGIIADLGGRSDRAVLFGLEHADYRPRNLPGGATALYDANGNIIKMLADGVSLDFQSRTVTMTGGQWNIAGDVTISGDLHVAGNITADGSIIDAAGNTNHHTH